jgi:hypothetical protein
MGSHLAGGARFVWAVLGGRGASVVLGEGAAGRNAGGRVGAEGR